MYYHISSFSGDYLSNSTGSIVLALSGAYIQFARYHVPDAGRRQTFPGRRQELEGHHEICNQRSKGMIG